MGQHANSSYPVKEGRTEPHAQTTIAQQLDGAIKPKNIGTFVIPEAKKPTKYGGWSVNPQLVDQRVGADIRKIRSESAEVDAFGIENVRKLRQMGFNPDQINAYIKALSFNAENILQTTGNDYKETISEKPLIAKNEAGYTTNLSKQEAQPVKEIEKPKEEEQKIKNFSQWNINHHIRVIQKSNKKDTVIEIKPATPEEIADEKASKILRPFLSAKRNEVKVKANENNLQPITPEAINNTSSVTPEVDEAAESIQDIPHSPVTNEEIAVLSTQSQQEIEVNPAEIQEEITRESKSLPTNPFTKLTGTISEEKEGAVSEVLTNESVTEEEVSAPATNTTTPSFMSRLAGEFAPSFAPSTEDIEISKEIEEAKLDIQTPEKDEVQTPPQPEPIHVSEKLTKRNEFTAKLLSTMEVYYGNDWSKYMMVKKGREDRINIPPVQGLETVKMRSWQDNLSDKAAELKNKIQ